MRSVFAVVVGYLAMSVGVALLFSAWLSNPAHTVTSAFMIFAAVIGFGAAIVGGYLTGLAAVKAPLGHAIALAILSGIMWCISTYNSQGQEPLWFQVTNLITVVSGVLVGGYLRQTQTQPEAQTEESS